MQMLRPLTAALLSCLTMACTSNAQETPPITSVLSARLLGTSEEPPVTSTGSGMLEATVNRQTMVISYTVTYAGLGGAATAGHFHGPAAVGANAGVALPLAGSLASPIKGEASLTAAQLAQLMAGLWYVNLHTAANPSGEIRGQVTVTP
ncbi:CHRD domain-containing protein [soil metagenome]